LFGRKDRDTPILPRKGGRKNPAPLFCLVVDRDMKACDNWTKINAACPKKTPIPVGGGSLQRAPINVKVVKII
jgi:hypothetical protein